MITSLPRPTYIRIVLRISMRSAGTFIQTISIGSLSALADKPDRARTIEDLPSAPTTRSALISPWASVTTPVTESSSRTKLRTRVLRSNSKFAKADAFSTSISKKCGCDIHLGRNSPMTEESICGETKGFSLINIFT